ncbi:MAG: 4-(cytidine 5'-diphospho)-2-C-methyl-D-erythritol kinase, partial [Pseudomonadota bacterium]
DDQSGENILEVTGPFAGIVGAGSDNLVVKAASKFQAATGNAAERPYHLKLEKNLPVASGLGGGSADAAATLLALAYFHGIEKKTDLGQIAKEIGADVPMCLESRLLRATGTGTDIKSLRNEASYPAVLVNPRIPLSTPDVFKALENKTNPAIDIEDGAIDMKSLQGLRNDLEGPAIKLAPQIKDVLTFIEDCPGCLFSRMSGSGTTCFGIFGSEDDAREAAARVSKARPEWWCVETTLISWDIRERIRFVKSEADIDE